MKRPSVPVLTAALALTVTGALIGPPVLAVAAPPVPKTIVLDGARLATIRQQVTTAPTAAQAAALRSLTGAADKALTAGPWSVLDKTSTVSPDKHDYYSLATYFWPNPDTADHRRPDRVGQHLARHQRPDAGLVLHGPGGLRPARRPGHPHLVPQPGH